METPLEHSATAPRYRSAALAAQIVVIFPVVSVQQDAAPCGKSKKVLNFLSGAREGAREGGREGGSERASEGARERGREAYQGAAARMNLINTQQAGTTRDSVHGAHDTRKGKASALRESLY